MIYRARSVCRIMNICMRTEGAVAAALPAHSVSLLICTPAVTALNRSSILLRGPHVAAIGRLMNKATRPQHGCHFYCF